MAFSLTEDDVYRASTQYRLWSFGLETLASTRKSTNHTAAVRVVAAIKRNRLNNGSTSLAAPARRKDGLSGTNEASGNIEADIETLTPTEEQVLLRHYARLMIRDAAQDTFELPPAVVATAAQYFKRFYVQNSVMTYHPKSILPACLYLAMKNCHQHMSLSRFARRLDTGQSVDDILAPEFLLCQGLRFCFDVRWPGRGLRGGLMELLEMCRANEAIGGRRLQQEMTNLPSVEDDLGDEAKQQKKTKLHELGERYEVYLLEKRCMAAYEQASSTLGDAALLTDVYFLYTPSQIWLAALWLADAPLTELYLSHKLRMGEQHKTKPQSSFEQKSRVMSTIKDCARVLSSHDASIVDRAELVRIDKKLYGCLNPEKQDMRRLRNAQKKRNGEDGALAESVTKKRRTERELARKDGEVFGPDLHSSNADLHKG